MDVKDEIRELAYELYEKSGRIENHDIDNWLEAEKTILARKSEMQSKEDELTAELQPVV